MDSTEFNPIPKWLPEYTGTSCQTQCIDSGLPVFARDVGDTAAKAYMGCGYEHFCLKYYAKANDRTRHTYELLQMNKPTKIYADFDHDNVADADAFVESTNKFMKAILAELVDVNPDIKFYILDATTKAKLSKHVIFECFLENIPTVEAFIAYVLKKCPCPYLDTKVYTRNRLFRILYSYKGGRDANSALKIEGTDTSSPYNPFNVFKTLIQAMMPVHYTGPLDSIKSELAHSVTVLKMKETARRNGYSNCSGHGDAPLGLSNFITAFSDGGAVVSTVKDNEGFITCVVGGKRCPWGKRIHKNNNQYFTIVKNTRQGYFQCADKDCPRTQYGHVDVGGLWAENLSRIN